MKTAVTTITWTRYDYYLDHGVAFPEHWKTAFSCDFLSRIAQEGAAQFARESALQDVSCRFVGAPAPLEAHTDGRIARGSILKMSIPVEYVLCTHVCNQVWLCHRGSFQGEDLCVNPFNERDLEERDLSTDLWQALCLESERPRKRIRAHLRIGGLAGLISKHDRLYNALMARSLYEAEERRSRLSLTSMDESRALAGYDPNPYNWKGGTRFEICYLWTIQSSERISGLTPIPFELQKRFFLFQTGFAMFFCFFITLAIYPFGLKEGGSLAMYPLSTFAQ